MRQFCFHRCPSFPISSHNLHSVLVLAWQLNLVWFLNCSAIALSLVALSTILILIFFQTVIPSAMLVIGLLNINNCPVKRRIPIWLIVFGGTVLFRFSIHFVYHMTSSRFGNKFQRKLNAFNGTVFCFLIVWFTGGMLSALVYSGDRVLWVAARLVTTIKTKWGEDHEVSVLQVAFSCFVLSIMLPIFFRFSMGLFSIWQGELRSDDWQW